MVMAAITLMSLPVTLGDLPARASTQLDVDHVEVVEYSESSFKVFFTPRVAVKNNQYGFQLTEGEIRASLTEATCTINNKCTATVSAPSGMTLTANTSFKISGYSDSFEGGATRYSASYVLKDSTPDLQQPVLTISNTKFDRVTLNWSSKIPQFELASGGTYSPPSLTWDIYKNNGICEPHRDLSRGTTSETCSNLQPETTYEFRVLADSLGSVRYSNTVSVTTPPERPTLGSVGFGDGEITVNWTSTSTDTVSVHVSPNPGGSPYSGGVGNSPDGGFKITEGVDNGESYTVRVSANGNFSEASRSGTPKRDLTLTNFSVSSTTRVYDQTTDLASCTGTVASGSTVTSDDCPSSFELGLTESGDGNGDADTDLTFSWTIAYGDKNVGDNKSVSFTSISITGGEDQNEWNLDTTLGTADSGSSEASITPRDLALNTFTVADKTYDGTTDATGDGPGGNPFSDQGNDDDDLDRIAGDDLSFDWTAEFSDKNVADGKTVSITGISIDGGDDQNNYNLVTTSGSTTANISERDLTLSNFSAEDKIYDGTTDVPVGTFDDDRVTVGGVTDELEFDFTAAFANKNVEDSETVNFTGISISGGADKDNYNLVTTSGSGTANIVERPVHLAGIRVYDATRLIEAADVAITDKDVVDTGLIGDETLVVGGAGWIETKNVGASLTLEVDAASDDDPVEGATGFTLADGENGGLAGNYTLVGGTHTVTVTQAPVTINGMEGVERIYDGSSTVELDGGSLVGIFEGDVVAMANNDEGEADSADVGKHDVTTEITLAGLDAPNYLLTQPVPEVEITTRELTVSGLRVQPKIYDGSNRAILTGATLNNVAAGGSAVSLTGATTGTFASPNAGVQSVAFTLGLTGANASNYTLVQPGALSGRINPAAAQVRFVSGLTWLEGIEGVVRVRTIPAGLDVAIELPGGQAPTEPGQYSVRAVVTDPNYDAAPAAATLTVLPVAGSNGGVDGQPGVVGTPKIGPVVLAGLLGSGSDVLGGATPGDPGTEFGGLLPGRAVVIQGDEVLQGVRIDSDPEGRVDVDTGSFALGLEARSGDDRPSPLGSNGQLELQQGGFVLVKGSGFVPGEQAEAWLFSTPTFIGAVDIDAGGNFEARMPVPDTMEIGEHTIQLNALDENGGVKSVSLGVTVTEPVAPVATDGGVGAIEETDGEGGFNWSSPVVAAWTLGLGFLSVVGLIVGVGWWILRQRQQKWLYVPEEFEVDTRVDQEFRR